MTPTTYPALDHPTDAEASTRAFSAALGALVRVVHFRDRDRACCYDLSVSQCHALERVVRAGALTVNELSGALYLDKSTTSRLAHSLVERKMLERTRDPSDGRVVLLRPTPAGAATCARIEEDLDAEYAQLLSGFDPEVKRAAAPLLECLAEAFAKRVEVANGRCCTIPLESPDAGNGGPS